MQKDSKQTEDKNHEPLRPRTFRTCTLLQQTWRFETSVDSIDLKINEIKKLLRETQNPVFKKQLESDLLSWLAIKDLIDAAKD